MADAAGSQALPFEGQVDAADTGEVRGWVWFPTAPEEAAHVEIVINGEVKGRAIADSERVDLIDAGKRGGRCAFSWRSDADQAEAVVRLADGRELPGSPLTIIQAGVEQLEFEGRVDLVDPHRIAGWCWFPTRPDLAPRLRVRAGAAIAAEGVAEQYRIDLKDKRDGYCAFDIVVPSLWEARASSIVVELEDGRALSPGESELPPRPANVFDNDDGQWPRRFLGVDGYIEGFGERVHGWAAPFDRGPPIELSVREGDMEMFKIVAGGWRKDLEDEHQGDGRGGFNVEAPRHMRDGRMRLLNIHYKGRPLFSEPVAITLAPAPEEVPPTLSERLLRRGTELIRRVRPVDFTFVVVFYNMRREAERTLTSLTRAYQRDSENVGYEVICVDNGSNPPLDENWIKSFGPEFRLLRPSKILPSPCFAINEAAAQARGKHVVIMVDGAHVLSPGVFHEAKAAIKEFPKSVVAVRHWFVGGDQRWLSAIGYTRELEDILFARAAWPTNGYNLFEIGATMHENPNHWFDPIAESNCLFVPNDLWRRIGGMDERFDIPGGGFCNLDLLRRAGKQSEHGVTCLLGEATFHQFHEGTTTNVTDAEKDARVRTYASTYRELRGEEFANIDTQDFRVRGRMHHYRAYSSRQRPLYQAPLGLTTRVRPGEMNRWLDLGAVEYINSAYAESGLYEKTRWRGEKIDLAPADLTNLQEILHDVRPERIVVTKPEPQIIRFLDDVAKLEGLDAMRIVCVIDEAPGEAHPRVDYVIGAPYDEATLKQVEVALGAAESTLVLFSPRDDDFFPLQNLRTYSRFVSFRSYLVVLRTVLGQPWLGYSKYWLKRVIYLFLQDSDFVHDISRDQHLISLCSSGYLLRTQATKPADDDSELENLGL